MVNPLAYVPGAKQVASFEQGANAVGRWGKGLFGTKLVLKISGAKVLIHY